MEINKPHSEQMKWVDDIIHSEKEVIPSPYLKTRIMQAIEKDAPFNRSRTMLKRSMQYAAIAASVAVTILAGVKTGSFYSRMSDQHPIELVFMDDASLESIEILINE